MKKLKLLLEDLRIDSFTTISVERGKGTVYGKQSAYHTYCTCGTNGPSGEPVNTCVGTCHGDYTCEYTCGGYVTGDAWGSPCMYCGSGSR